MKTISACLLVLACSLISIDAFCSSLHHGKDMDINEMAEARLTTETSPLVDISGRAAFSPSDESPVGAGLASMLSESKSISQQFLDATLTKMAEMGWSEVSANKAESTINIEAMFNDASVNNVPLPASIWLLGSALVILGNIRRKRH